jgi:hypothetical protein
MAVTINGTTGVAVPLGSAGAPGVVNTTSATTGIYNPTSTTLALATNGTQAVVVDASQNVGVGTATPISSAGSNSVTINGATGGGRVDFLKAGTQFGVIYSAATNLFDIEATGASTSMRFNTNGANRMIIDAAGIITGTAGNLMLVQGIAQASTSGTSIDFTGIPSWAKRIVVMFSGVSTSGTSLVQIQLGTSSGPTTTGYSSASFSYNSGTGATSTTGLVVDQVVSAANTRYGLITIATLGSNIWVSQGTLQMTSSLSVTPSTGGVTLGAVLDRVRITTVGGTDTFDAGTINIQYE